MGIGDQNYFDKLMQSLFFHFWAVIVSALLSFVTTEIVA